MEEIIQIVVEYVKIEVRFYLNMFSVFSHAE